MALANARVYWRTQRLASQLEEAPVYPRPIDQAKGIIIGERGCSADEAFQFLVGVSQRSHMKLRDVASELVERAMRRAADGRDQQVRDLPGKV